MFRVICTSVDRLRYSAHESLFDGSEEEGARCSGPRHPQKRDSAHTRCLRAYHKTLSQIEKRDRVCGTQALSQTSLLNRPERRAEKGLVEAARRAQRRHSGETLPTLGEKPRSEGFYLHHEPGYTP